MVEPYSLLTEHDIYLFREGKHYKLYEKMGAQAVVHQGKSGFCFSVWAPNAKNVAIIGDFNHWSGEGFSLFPRWDGSGIWEGFVAELTWGTKYKFAIETHQGNVLEKSDPYALSWEQTAQAASLISTTWYEWKDDHWMANRHEHNSLSAPISVYEMHLASWMRDASAPEKFLNYREIAEKLVPYLLEMDFTHVEFMPVMEYPYEPSWGYQITGFFAATSRFGAPQDLMFLIDQLHQNNIGVILDWVPSHFPGDANGLFQFDGSCLYEHSDPKRGFHPEWKSYIFDYGKNEVRSFLISNAMFWLERYHADGLRVDAVTSMLHLDYARNEGEWEPNIFGNNVNLEAKSFLQEMNSAVYGAFGNRIVTIAEESSDFPKVTKPVDVGGIGFGMKWMMGWMHDTLKYFKTEYSDRRHVHHKITFSSMYMYNEQYMMPLSHDEVVHGKASLIYKMVGDEWQKFANLRTLFVYLFTHPGAKLLFMGDEIGQTSEWNFRKNVEWHLLQHPVHSGLQKLVKDLNFVYRSEKSLFETQFSPEGFQWIQADDAENSVFIYLRKGRKKQNQVMIILNMKPNAIDYQFGVSKLSKWKLLLSSDDEQYAGSGIRATIFAEETKKWNHYSKAISVNLPPLCGLIFKREKDSRKVLYRIKRKTLKKILS